MMKDHLVSVTSRIGKTIHAEVHHSKNKMKGIYNLIISDANNVKFNISVLQKCSFVPGQPIPALSVNWNVSADCTIKRNNI